MSDWLPTDYVPPNLSIYSNLFCQCIPSGKHEKKSLQAFKVAQLLLLSCFDGFQKKHSKKNVKRTSSIMSIVKTIVEAILLILFVYFQLLHPNQCLLVHQNSP